MNFSYHTYFFFVPYITHRPNPNIQHAQVEERKNMCDKELENKCFTTRQTTSIIWHNNKERQ